MEKQYVSFEIVHKKYCIDIMDVKEVVKENNITSLPDSPYFVEGIMNLRGMVIPVISIKKKLGLKNDEKNATITLLTDIKSQTNKLIIITIEGVLIGFMVDTLDRVFSVDISQIQASERVTESGIDKSLVNGVIKQEEELYLILDIKKILDFEEKTFIKKEIIE